jgi:hypothetical protein
VRSVRDIWRDVTVATVPAPSQPFLLLSPLDNVAIARVDVEAGQLIDTAEGRVGLPVRIARGHKIAYRSIAPGEKIIKYGAPIGSATRSIAPGEHAHVHNIKSDYTPTHLIASKSRTVEE